MTKLIVSYDLGDHDRNGELVRDTIKSLGSWEHIHYSVFEIETALSKETVYSLINEHLCAGDRLLVYASDPNGLVSNRHLPLASSPSPHHFEKIGGLGGLGGHKIR